jgi:hypothetical protein
LLARDLKLANKIEQNGNYYFRHCVAKVLRLKNEEAAMNKIHGLLAIMALCIVLVPVIAYSLGGWYAYWGHALLAVVFGVLAVFIKTRYYWEEE